MDRKEAPKAEWERATDWAACRQAWVARFTTVSVRERNTRPPETSWCGANPSHEQQGLTVGNLVMSVPISARIVCALEAEIPVTATTSPPVRRMREARASSRGVFCDFAPGLVRGHGVGGSSRSNRGFMAANWRSIWASHSTIFWV
jgi:hypothetical protein